MAKRKKKDEVTEPVVTTAEETKVEYRAPFAGDNVLDRYQEFTRTTAVYPKDRAIEYLSLGLVSEAGEVAGKIKKHIRGDSDILDVDAVISEVADVIWYCVRLLDELECDAAIALAQNRMKLEKRLEENKIKGDGDNR